MVKMNYTKIEDSFDEGMRKFEVGKLFELTKEEDKKRERIRQNKLILKKLEHDLRFLDRQGVKPYDQLKLKKSEIKRLQDLEVFGPDDLTLILTLKKKVETLKEKTKAKSSISGLTPDESIVKKERVNQVNKRYNIQGHWLPT